VFDWQPTESRLVPPPEKAEPRHQQDWILCLSRRPNQRTDKKRLVCDGRSWTPRPPRGQRLLPRSISSPIPPLAHLRVHTPRRASLPPISPHPRVHPSSLRQERSTHTLHRIMPGCCTTQPSSRMRFRPRLPPISPHPRRHPSSLPRLLSDRRRRLRRRKRWPWRWRCSHTRAHQPAPGSSRRKGDRAVRSEACMASARAVVALGWRHCAHSAERLWRTSCCRYVNTLGRLRQHAARADGAPLRAAHRRSQPLTSPAACLRFE
jgi:hypothetical protein